MKKLIACALCLSVSAVFAIAGGTAPSIEGSWTLTSAIDKGVKAPEDLIAKEVIVATFAKDGKYTVTAKGEPFEAGTYKIDTKAKPAQIDLIVLEGKDKGKKQFGIFKVEADKATFSIGSSGKVEDRPKNFEGGKEVEVTVFNRNK